jgi:hypothetical protein
MMVGAIDIGIGLVDIASLQLRDVIARKATSVR